MRTVLSLSLLLTACLKPYPVDWDGDGVKAPDDCDDQDPTLGSRTLDPECDGLDTGSIDTDDADSGGTDSGDTDNDTAIQPSLSVELIQEISSPYNTGFGIQLDFSTESPEGELSNYTLALSVEIDNGTPQQRTFQIPTDFTAWTGNRGVIQFALRPCELLGDMNWTLKLEGTEAGILSRTGSLRNSFSGPSDNQSPKYVLLDESLEATPDVFQPSDWQSQGDSPFEPELPHLFCGDIHSAAEGTFNNIDRWVDGGDVDFIKLNQTVQHTATLYATESDTVFDFGRFYQPDLPGTLAWTRDMDSLEHGPGPLDFEASQVPTQFHYIHGYSGSLTDWWVIIR